MGELREEMKELPNVNWQLVVRRTLKRELEEILELKRIISKSKLTEEDVEKLSDKINESLRGRGRSPRCLVFRIFKKGMPLAKKLDTWCEST